MSVRLAVVLPVGPHCRPAFVADTIASIERYCVEDRLVIVVDDSRIGTGERCAAEFGARVIATPGFGRLGGLYHTLSVGFLAALEAPFDVLLRLDTDALVVAEGFERVALERFRADPRVGCLGSYRLGYDGQPRAYRWSRRQLMLELSAGMVRRPRSALRLAGLVARAAPHGYTLGESVFGGVCVYSATALAALAEAGLLADERLARTGLEEDHIFAACLGAAGFGLADFSEQVAARHLGLPASPQELIAGGRALIHSTRSWERMSEQEIRRQFAEARRHQPEAHAT